MARDEATEPLGCVVLRDVMDIAHRRRDGAVPHERLHVGHWPNLNGQGAEGVAQVVEHDRVFLLAHVAQLRGLERLKERIADELYGAADSEERAIQVRKVSLTENVRRTVLAELEAERAEQAATAAALEDREAAVAAREREASPSYRARFTAAGAILLLTADTLIRTVA